MFCFTQHNHVFLQKATFPYIRGGPYQLPQNTQVNTIRIGLNNVHFAVVVVMLNVMFEQMAGIFDQ